MKHYFDMLLYVFSLLFIIFSLSVLWKKYSERKLVCWVQDVQQIAQSVNTFCQRYGKRHQKNAKIKQRNGRMGQKGF